MTEDDGVHGSGHKALSNSTMDLTGIESILGHTFNDKNIIREALTHRSYLNENTLWDVPHNERLEFLGDAVLELAVTEALYNRYPEDPEGQLTSLRAALVNYQMLGSIGRDINLEPFIYLSRGEAKDTGRARDVILANAMESVIGALHLDGGYAVAKKFIEKYVLARLDDVLRDGSYKDSKSSLQERVQRDKKITPHYQILRADGPDHAKTFTAGVYFGDDFIAEGTGRSKHEAEQRAAEAALLKLGDES